jgi:hypothetical protein
MEEHNYSVICIDGCGTLIKTLMPSMFNKAIFSHSQDYPKHRIHKFKNGKRI